MSSMDDIIHIGHSARNVGLTHRLRHGDVDNGCYEIRRHPEAARLTWLAAFVYLRGRSLTDDLVDLLIETIHHIGARAERRVERELLLDDLKRVSGKQNLLFQVADASLDKPDGRVRNVVFPVVGEETLRDLVARHAQFGTSSPAG